MSPRRRAEPEPVREYIVITGMSGAGRSTAADTLEDLGWFVIDNLPAALIAKVVELVDRPGSDTQRVALVSGRGGPEYAVELTQALEQLRRSGALLRIVFLDAADEVLVRRYEDTRRRHPLVSEGVADAIARERQLLGPVKALADVVVDTSGLNVHQLRDRLVELIEREEGSGMRTAVVSFGYKHGLPLDVDLVLDCRFLPNPHWVEELRLLSGLDEPVRDYVLAQPATGAFLDKLDDLLGLLLPAYRQEGKTYLSLAVGCTGGRHRSVVLADEIARRMWARGFAPAVSHRDVHR